jgi:DNA-binding transcriptional LysR family regulator
MKDLNDVLAFTHVADLGSFTAAAARLGWPKSSVSERVARLEAELGARLLERSTRRVRLTIVGERYHEHARRVLFELEQASATVEVFRSAPCGALRISASVVLGQTLLAPLVLEYVAAFPEVSVFADFSNRRVDLLEEGFDVAVRAGTLPESSLVARRIGQAGAGLYAAPAYLAQHGRPEEAEALRRHVLIDSAAQAQTRSWTLQHAHSGQVQQLDGLAFRLVSNDTPTLQAAASAGLGIASLAHFAARPDVEAGRLVPVLPDWWTRRLEIHAVFPSFKSLSPAVRAFVDLIAEQLPARLAHNAAPTEPSL